MFCVQLMGAVYVLLSTLHAEADVLTVMVLRIPSEDNPLTVKLTVLLTAVRLCTSGVKPLPDIVTFIGGVRLLADNVPDNE